MVTNKTGKKNRNKMQNNVKFLNQYKRKGGKKKS